MNMERYIHIPGVMIKLDQLGLKTHFEAGSGMAHLRKNDAR